MFINRTSNEFWRGRRVLITGHTGFKGSWLCLWLLSLGADVSGISLIPKTEPNLFSLSRLNDSVRSFFVDIRDQNRLTQILRAINPEIIFHLAAQPLVRASYRAPVETFSTNVMGTVNLLEAIRYSSMTRVALMVTSDKVYRENSPGHAYSENDSLGGCDPYSASKAAAEIVISSYYTSFLERRGVGVATARAGNVIGGGDWSEDRLIPDAIRAWQSGEMIHIRRPNAVRPWQHVLESLYGYLSLAENLWFSPELSGPYNFGPCANEVVTVKDLVSLACHAYGEGGATYADAKDGPYEADWLALNSEKSRTSLGFESKWGLQESVIRTVQWYKAQNAGRDASELCFADITQYERSNPSERR